MANADTHLGRSSLRALRAVAAVVLGCLLVSLGGRAEASCGDWLAGHGRIEAASGDVAPLSDAILAVARPLSRSDAPLPVRPVCDGPACRGIPPLPVVPGDGVAIDVVVDPACLVTVGDAPDRPAVAAAGFPGDFFPLSASGSVPTPPPRPVALPA